MPGLRPGENPRAELRRALAALDSAGEEAPRICAAAAVLGDRAEALLEWMEINGIDPGDPPSCGCGGRHWSCPGGEPDAGEHREDNLSELHDAMDGF